MLVNQDVGVHIKTHNHRKTLLETQKITTY